MKIIQILDAPQGFVLRYEVNGKQHQESPVCLALIERGSTTEIVPMELADGKILPAADNPAFVGYEMERQE
jgi:hypothetical protein